MGQNSHPNINRNANQNAGQNTDLNTDLKADLADLNAPGSTRQTHPKISLPKIQAALAAEGAHLGIEPQFQQIRSKFDVHVFEHLPSTSTQLWQMISQGAGAGTVAIARQQSSGRGQHGRIWQSEPGGLYLSLALEPDLPISNAAQLTCMSTWGIATALNNLGIPVKIKWPNDLFFNGKKLGGILTETKIAHPNDNLVNTQTLPETRMKSPPRLTKAVIGVGINWDNSVPDTAITLTQIMAQMPKCAAQNKINCLEVLAALVLKGILQGCLFQQRVSSQVFMKAYSKMLTQTDEIVSLESSLLNLSVPGEHSDVAGSAQWSVSLVNKQLANYSGTNVGVSEEGYLKGTSLDLDLDLNSGLDPSLDLDLEAAPDLSRKAGSFIDHSEGCSERRLEVRLKSRSKSCSDAQLVDVQPSNRVAFFSEDS